MRNDSLKIGFPDQVGKQMTDIQFCDDEQY